MLPPLIKNVAFAVLMTLMAVAAMGYALGMRRWLRRLREVSQASATSESHAAFMATDEYRRLRQGVRLPMFAATVLFLLLFLLVRYG